MKRYEQQLKTETHKKDNCRTERNGETLWGPKWTDATHEIDNNREIALWKTVKVRTIKRDNAIPVRSGKDCIKRVRAAEHSINFGKRYEIIPSVYFCRPTQPQTTICRRFSRSRIKQNYVPFLELRKIKLNGPYLSAALAINSRCPLPLPPFYKSRPCCFVHVLVHCKSQ